MIARHGVQPVPHVPTPSERLRLLYLTGDESGLSPVDDRNDIWSGTLPIEEQTSIRAAEGVLERGQVWEDLLTEGASAVEELSGDA